MVLRDSSTINGKLFLPWIEQDLQARALELTLLKLLRCCLLLSLLVFELSNWSLGLGGCYFTGQRVFYAFVALLRRRIVKFQGMYHHMKTYHCFCPPLFPSVVQLSVCFPGYFSFPCLVVFIPISPSVLAFCSSQETFAFNKPWTDPDGFLSLSEPQREKLVG